MRSETLKVNLLLPDKSIEESSLEIELLGDVGSSDPWRISFRHELLSNIFEGRDLFEAFSNLRMALEGIGCFLLCAGGRRDVYPSGMSRSMSGGRKAYILRMGSPGEKKDIVDIFSYSDPELLATVADQKAFYHAWLDSLPQTSGSEPRSVKE